MADRADRLLELLRERSFARKKVVLTSGRESDFFIDCKQAVLLAEGHALVGEAMLRAIEERLAPARRPVAVAGVELGGCPLASAVAVASFRAGRPLDAIYVRKEAKEHGSKRQLEGDAHLPDGSPVVVLEDTSTTGGSTLRAVEKLRARNLEVAGVVTVVDRLEGAAEAFAEARLPFVALYTRKDFIP